VPPGQSAASLSLGAAVVEVQALVDRRGLAGLEALDHGHTVRLQPKSCVKASDP
jgi:hypothetical protein